MKLVYCTMCEDVLRLQKHARTCECGASGGHYVDELNAVFWGASAVPLGFDNSSLVQAMDAQPAGPGTGSRFEAFVIPRVCATLVKLKPGTELPDGAS